MAWRNEDEGATRMIGIALFVVGAFILTQVEYVIVLSIAVAATIVALSVGLMMEKGSVARARGGTIVHAFIGVSLACCTSLALNRWIL